MRYWHSTWTTWTRARVQVGTSSPQRRLGKRSKRQTELCKGIVLGLYRAEHRGFELLEYAEDCPSELAGHAVDIWQRRRRNYVLPRTFVEKFTPDWDWLVR